MIARVKTSDGCQLFCVNVDSLIHVFESGVMCKAEAVEVTMRGLLVRVYVLALTLEILIY